MVKKGRRGKYHDWISDEGLTKLEGWARDGLTDEQIAHNIGISRSTLAVWKNTYSDISDALKKGKEVVDREVENALHKGAIGYFVEEIETFIDVAPDGTKKKRVKKNKKWIPGNATSQIFWLKNRKPEEWRDKTETAITGGLNIVDTVNQIDKYLEDVGIDNDDGF